jgi:hypothetical protein
VTVVCAPAGSGKTVLLRSWAAETDAAVAWVTVERGERDAQRFWLHVIDAVADAAGDEVIERVSPAPQFAGAVVLERLLAQLERLEEPLALVIDDLHELDSGDALVWLEMLLRRLPARLRVVLATREEPALGLHRLRLVGGLAELRGPDLRFSLDETRSLLRASGIALSITGLDSLQERTEGWPAGLRLAAISLTTHPDPERFVSEFSGSERTVAGYLLAEVLERQPPEVRDLLLRTSILERVCGPLADALTGGNGAEATLQRLEDQNAFVTSLDAARTWFRYHHLFADLLRLELRRVAPATIQSLHSTAAAWHEQRRGVVEAVRHYEAGIGPNLAGLAPYWEDRVAAEPAARAFLRLDATRAQYVEGVADPESLDPDLWTLDQHFLDLPQRDRVMLDLFYDYTSNVALYPTWQTYLRDQQPATLVTWGANDRYFVADGARAYLTDVPNAELHLLDTGHFALVTHAEEIADLIAAFHARHTAGDPTTAGPSS